MIAFLVMLFLVGLPLFFLDVTISQFSKFGAVDVWKIVPPFRGTVSLQTCLTSKEYISKNFCALRNRLLFTYDRCCHFNLLQYFDRLFIDLFNFVVFSYIAVDFMWFRLDNWEVLQAIWIQNMRWPYRVACKTILGVCLHHRLKFFYSIKN